MTQRQKAKGERGSWFAEVGQERLPCEHSHWVKNICHDNDGLRFDLGTQIAELY